MLKTYNRGSPQFQQYTTMIDAIQSEHTLSCNYKMLINLKIMNMKLPLVMKDPARLIYC